MRNRPFTYIAGWLGAALLCVPGNSDASVRAYSQKELCQVANVIVIATVRGRHSDWLDDGSTILTTVNLSVDQVITGGPRENVIVKTLGGKIGDVVQRVGEEPAMPIGSKYFLLMSQPTTTSPPLLIGGVFGARRIDPDATLPSTSWMVAQWQEACDVYL